MPEPEKESVIVPENPEPEKEEITLEGLSVEGLSDEEKEMLERQNKDEEKHPAPKKAVVPEKTNPEKEPKEELKEEDYDTFEKVHSLYEHDKERFYSLPRAVKNQYHNAKGLYKRVKEEEERRKKIEDDGGYNRLQDHVAKAKIDRISRRIAEAKADPEHKGLTVEELEELVDLQRKEDNDNRPLTRKDLEDLQKEKDADDTRKAKEERERQQRVNDKIRETEIYAKDRIFDLTGGKYNNFDAVVTLASEVTRTNQRFGRAVAEALNGEDSVEEVVDILIGIAKINPKWGIAPAKKEGDLERIEKNAQKIRTSASLPSGKGGKVVSYDDLTPEDAVKLTEEQWGQLPRRVRQRLLMEAK